MSSWGISIITAVIVWGVIRWMTKNNTRGNEFQLYRVYYRYGGSERSITVGIFGSKDKAEEALNDLESKNTSDGMKYGFSKVAISTFRGREGNLVYEWSSNNAGADNYFFFTKTDYLEEIKRRLEGSDKGNTGNIKSYEINKLYIDEDGSPEAAV